MIKSLEDILADKFGYGSQNPAVRQELAATLHARPIGLLLGASCGIAAGVSGIFTTQNTNLKLACFALVLLAVSRAITAVGAKHLTNSFGDFLRSTYWIGALGYAAMSGLAAGLALYVGENTHMQILLVGFALIFGAGIAVGNAGRPIIALSQMGLTFLPIIIACIAIASAPLLVLATILPSMTLGLALVTLKIFQTLTNQVSTARESKVLAELMQDQARTDSVTGLANRTGFEAGAEEILEQAQASHEIALFWMDLHRLKEVNDMLGHQTGDQVLCEIADRLRSRMPQDAVIARFGSDEFLVMASFPSRREVDQMAGNLCSDLALPMRISGHRIETGACIGVCLIDDLTPDLDQLMQHADLALYHAKVAGRHQICFFNHTMTRNLIRKKEIEADLRSAIQKDELSIYFQPIIDLETGRIRAFEALVRWFHPEKGELVPDEFIPVAEETGLIITLGNWITRQAAQACASWPDHVMLAVNLSPLQIRAPGAALGILNALNEAKLDPSRLELEVTENLFVEDSESTSYFMEQLAGEGVSFSLDDFGTGYSSLHYINKYPFRTIKVDRSFVSGPKTGLRSDAIIRAVAEMGSTLGMEIVAEGLETAEQVHAVRSAGCTLGQGYHFSRAVPEHLAARLLEDEASTVVDTRLAG